MAENDISLRDVTEASRRISSFIHKTPVITSSQANKRSGRNLFFKCENLQKTGSFKARGALNAVLQAKGRSEARKGFVTHSSGNHGQALAWASDIAGLPCYVVVPSIAPEVKKKAIKGYGARLVQCGNQPQDRIDVAEKVRLEKSLHLIAPHDNPDVIAGQGTIALEFLEQVPDLDAILIPISGGDLSSGIAIAAKSIKPTIKIFLVCPKGKRMEECLRTGQRPWKGPPRYLKTFADGIRHQQTGYLTAQILIELAEKDVFEMEEQEIIDGVKFAFERMKTVIEGAAGASMAASLSEKLKAMDPSMANVGVILCGGNIDINHLPW